MTTIIALIGALSLASIPMMLGWRRMAGEAEMARALGLSAPRSAFDPEAFARRTGTGLTFSQLLFGFAGWFLLGFAAGFLFGALGAALFSTGAVLL